MFKKTLTAVVVLGMAANVFAGRFDLDVPNFNAKTPIQSQNLVGSPNISETVVDVDVTGIMSFDEQGSPANTVLSIDLGALSGQGTPTVITGIGWDLTQTAGIDSGGASWLSEQVFALDWDLDGVPDVNLTPSATGAPGTESNSSGGILLLADAGIPDGVSPSGVITVELFESFVDEPGAAEGMIDAGTLSFQVQKVPEPSSIILIALAGLSLLGIRRR